MNFTELISAGKPALVSFGAEWCEPCKWLEPILAEVEQSLDGKISVHKIDVDEHPELKKLYHIRSVPTLLLFKKGDVKWRYQGFDTPAVMRKIILEHL